MKPIRRLVVDFDDEDIVSQLVIIAVDGTRYEVPVTIERNSDEGKIKLRFDVPDELRTSQGDIEQIMLSCDLFPKPLNLANMTINWH